MRKKLSFFIITFSIIFLPTAIFLGTEWGLQLAVKLGTGLSGGHVKVGSAQGTLLSKYSLTDISIATPVADVSAEDLFWEWRPFSLFQGQLEVFSGSLQSLTVQLHAQESGDIEETTSSPPPFIALPINILLHDLSIEDVKIVDPEGEVVFQIDQFKTSLELASDRLLVNSFLLEGPEVELDFHGNVLMSGEKNTDLIGSWGLVGYGFHPSKGTFSFKGPMNRLGVNVALNDPGEIRVVGILLNLLQNPTWTAKVDARNVNLETWILHCPEIILESVHGDMHGDFGHYRGDVDAYGYWGVADELHLQSNIDGSAWGIVFNSLRIDRNSSSAVATNASISWEKVFSWEADLDFDNFLLSMFFPDFDGSVSSTFHSIGDVTEEEELIASFALKTMDGQVGEYHWSAAGNIGLTEDYIFSDDLTIRSDSVGGKAKVNHVEFSWEEELRWKTDLKLENFNPGFLHPEAAGKINGELKSLLEWQGETPVGSLAMQNLNGELRGAPLSGDGNLRVEGGSISSPGLDIVLGESQLHVIGGVDDNFGLEFDFSSPDLSQIADILQGSLELSGEVAGSRAEPELSFAVSAKDIIANGFSSRSIDGTVQLSSLEDSPVAGNIELKDSKIWGYSLPRLVANLDGNRLTHNLKVELEAEDGTLGLELAGGYQERWLGKLTGVSLLSKDYSQWEQQGAADIEISSEDAAIQELCLSNSRIDNSGSACISLSSDFTQAIEWAIEGGLNSFSLKPFGKMKLGLPPLTGAVDGAFSARGDSHSVQAGDVILEVATVDTLLSVTDDEFVTLQVRNAKIESNLKDERLEMDASVTTTQGGQLDLEGSVMNFGAFATPLHQSPISADFTLDKYHLNALAALTGFGVEPTGWVSSSLGLSGTLAQPEIYGQIEIQEGGIELPYQGISLEDVMIAIDSGEYGAQVRGRARSGGGELTAEGTLNRFEDGYKALLNLKGENFLLVNLPEYSFKVSPDAKVTITKDQVIIAGEVSVPTGLIAPEELSEAVKVSDDVVYTGAETAHENKTYPVELDLDVLLGDDVTVDGYGLKGRLGGKLNVKVTPAEFITGRGELDLLDATFTFYGRSLDIARGRMLFTGGPIDNPGVDIRAQKIVTAETARGDGYTVGVDINGLVQDLQFHLFSDPYMEDTEILSQMVVGRSFASSGEQEGTLLQAAAMSLGLEGSSKLMKGITNLLLVDELHLEGSPLEEDVSLVVGKRITEDLYIGYDMNMYSQLGQFRVRYDLKRGFYVETRSSSESTGADLIYSFER